MVVEEDIFATIKKSQSPTKIDLSPSRITSRLNYNFKTTRVFLDKWGE